MQVITRAALGRLGLGLVVAVLGLALAVRYACRCGGDHRGPPPTAMITTPELQRHVEHLAGTIGERNLVHPSRLAAAAAYIEKEWQDQGYAVTRHRYRLRDQDCANLEITLPGHAKPGEIILVGAHYDSVEGSPGANDNASGVAAMLAISRVLGRDPAVARFARTLRFVAFVNEEPPYFETAQQGSRVYARLCRSRGDDIRAMFALETIGCYTDQPRSQQYPAPLSLFYPSTGNFIGFVSNLKSRALLQQSVAAFRRASDFPAACCALPPLLPGIGWSDHASFWREGYPAVMITDTAPFRYAHYHLPSDTPDQVNFPALARVTDGVRQMLEVLAGAPALP